MLSQECCACCVITQQPRGSTDEGQPLIISSQPSAGDAESPNLDILTQALNPHIPAGITPYEWRDRIKCLYQYVVAPIAGINGFEGAQEGAETFFSMPSYLSWMCGLGGWLGYTTGFYGASIPTINHHKSVAIASGMVSAIGAIPSAALTVESTEYLRTTTLTCIQSSAFMWLDFLFASANGISNFVIGLDEGNKWGVNFKEFFHRLIGSSQYTDAEGNLHELPQMAPIEKVIMVLCGLIIAYCAATSVIGYTPPVVHLVAKFAPSTVASACSILANVAEWMFMTNMMFTQNKEAACCWHCRSPLPLGWRENRKVAAGSIGIGLMVGLAMASYTFSALSNPVLAVIFAQTAWTGGFWTAVGPSYNCLSNPKKIVGDIYQCFIRPCISGARCIQQRCFAPCCTCCAT